MDVIDMNNFGEGGEEDMAETEAETSFIDNETSFGMDYGWELDHDLILKDLRERVEAEFRDDTTTSAAEKRSETYRRKAYVRELFGVDIAKGNGRYSKEFLEKTSIEKDGGMSYEGTKVVVVDKATGKLRYSANATRKVGDFMDALNYAHNERVEIVAIRRQAQERLTMRNNLEADSIGSEIESRQDELQFDSRGLVGVLEMDVDDVLETDRVQPGFADDKIQTINDVEKPYWEDQARKAANEHDRGLFESIVRLCDQRIDEIRILQEKEPLTEEGKGSLEESNDVTRFQRVKEWMKNNLGVMSAIGIGIAGVITTVVLNGGSVIRKGAQATSKFAKAVANLAKKFGAVLGPLLSIVGQVLSWGAKGLAFLAENMWMLALILTYVAYDRLKGRWIQGKPKLLAS
jgi:hypothetical protein